MHSIIYSGGTIKMQLNVFLYDWPTKFRQDDKVHLLIFSDLKFTTLVTIRGAERKLPRRTSYTTYET